MVFSTTNAIQIQFLSDLDVAPKVINVEPKMSATSLHGICKTFGASVQLVHDAKLRIAPGAFCVFSAHPVSSIR